MSKHTTTISRLASANPVRPDVELGRSPEAQATLRRILAEEREPDRAPSARRALPSSRRLLAVLAVLVLGTGTAFAATDPFGWWSANPQTALYQTDLTRHVTTPTATAVNCTPLTGGLFQCAARSAGRPYRLIDHIQAVHANPFSRSAIIASVNQALQTGRGALPRSPSGSAPTSRASPTSTSPLCTRRTDTAATGSASRTPAAAGCHPPECRRSSPVR